MALTFYRKPTTTSGSGGTASANSAGVPVLTKAQARTLGRSPEAIGTGFRERNADDPYAQALATYYKQVETEIANYRRQLEQKRVQASQAVTAAQKAYQEAQTALDEQKIIMANRPAGSRAAHYSPEYNQKLQAARDQAAQALNDAQTQAGVIEKSWVNDFKEFSAQQRAKYQEVEQTASALTDRMMKQRGYDTDYEKARKEYEAAVTQHDKDRAAYDMYKAQKSQYDTDAAQRQADIDAGRYAVNPYLFMAQGASLNEIEDLRKQMNEGNLRPNMRMPAELVAPTEVKDPGEFMTDMPTRQTADDVYVSDNAAAALGYEQPKERKADAELPTVSTEKTDTSSVASNYTSPETTPDKPTEEEKQVPPQQAPPPTTNTLQQTSSQSAQPTQATPQSPPQQQPSVATTNPDTTLPEQESGTVSGQQSQGGQQPQAQPEPEGEAKVFKPGEEEDEEQVFGSG